MPLATLGGLFGLLIAGSSINTYSEIGLIILVGVAAKNGILIVEFANQLRDQGRSVSEAVIESAAIRLRPIIMTSIAAAMGSLPLILAGGPGAGSRRTIGVVIFTGAIFATLLTLFVVPVFYNLLGRFTKSPQWTARLIDSFEAEPNTARRPSVPCRRRRNRRARPAWRQALLVPLGRHEGDDVGAVLGVLHARKVILVSGSMARGSVIHFSSVGASQVRPEPFMASEKSKSGTMAALVL